MKKDRAGGRDSQGWQAAGAPVFSRARMLLVLAVR